MSGGVDSSVAAYLLRRNGYTVTGATMCFGISDEQGRPACCGPRAVHDARKVCRQLGMAHYVLDFSRQLYNDVIVDFIGQYARGRTPNPCVRCNRYLKFSALFDHARSCGYDAIATGHYAKVIQRHGKPCLARHHDRLKDQSYFLYSIPQPVLENVEFPLARYTKSEVRTLALEQNLHIAQKSESQEICFITDNDYRGFLERNGVAGEPGPFIDTSGKVLGMHKGISNYTIGQRKGLGIAAGSPRYIVAINSRDNSIILGSKNELTTDSLTAGEVNLFTEILPETCTAKIRSTQQDVECHPVMEDGRLKVYFRTPVEAVTPGQSIVLYEDDIVLGGGVIDYVVQ